MKKKLTFTNLISGSVEQTALNLHLDIKETDGTLDYVTCSLTYRDQETDYFQTPYGNVTTVSSTSIMSAIEEAILLAVSASAG